MMLSTMSVSTDECNAPAETKSATARPKESSIEGQILNIFPTRRDSEMEKLTMLFPGKYGSPQRSRANEKKVLPAALETPTNQEPHEGDGFDEMSSIERKRQAVLSRISSTKNGTGVVLDLNDFYKNQKAKRVGDNMRKEEAAENLRSFRNLTPEKTVKPKDKVDSVDTSAADRAAAAQSTSQATQGQNLSQEQKIPNTRQPTEPPLRSFFHNQKKGQNRQNRQTHVEVTGRK